MSIEFAIQTQGLTKYFGNKLVVDELDLKLPRGSVTGLLGLNGAGKSTTLKMLLGFLEPTRGVSSVLGRNSIELRPEDRARIGYTVEGHFLYRWMTVRQIEEFQRDTFPRWNSKFFNDTVQRFGIEPSQKCGALSRGQQAGVSLALTLSADPELLVLDDPALGLDPVSRRALNETLIDYCDGGVRTILLSSHMLDDIERIADRIAVMVHGQLVVDTTLDDFRQRVAAWAIDLPPATRRVEAIPRVIQTRKLGGRTVVTIANPSADSYAALCDVSESEPTEIPVTFEDAIVAYLTRNRSAESFLTATETLAKTTGA